MAIVAARLTVLLIATATLVSAKGFPESLVSTNKDAYNCTKSGCWFSFTNTPDKFGAILNDGRCGEVDAAQRIPNDIWDDPNAVQKYVKATLRWYQFRNAFGEGEGLTFGQCNHDPARWIQNGTGTANWTISLFYLEVCNELCGCGIYHPCKDVPDNPSRHNYCSLCGPKFSHPVEITFYYPRFDPRKNIVQLAQSDSDLSTLVSALVAGKLTATLSGTGPYTVFAPTNEAFGKLPSSTLKHLLDPKNEKELDAVLEYHVVPGQRLHSKDLKTFQEVTTVEGDKLTIVKTALRVIVNNATVTTADIDAKNGVIHIIDSVLIPPPSK